MNKAQQVKYGNKPNKVTAGTNSDGIINLKQE